MKIAIQGIRGCFHQIAANNYFNQEVDVLCCENFPKLVKQVERNNCDSGIMAIENTIAGSILQNYKLLQESSLKIIGEVYLPIQQNLITLPDTKLEEIEEVLSHPMAIYQCSKYLSGLNNIKVIETEDTAASVKLIKNKGWKNKAAIASDLSAKIYDMKVLEHSIETNKKNYTRFLIIEKNMVLDLESTNKASIYFSVSHKKGSLAKILSIFENHNINLSKLQSFPIIGHNWQYYFHVDLEYMNITDYRLAINEMKVKTNELKTLGNYKQGTK